LSTSLVPTIVEDPGGADGLRGAIRRARLDNSEDALILFKRLEVALNAFCLDKIERIVRIIK
jgi:hypothetical protein